MAWSRAPRSSMIAKATGSPDSRLPSATSPNRTPSSCLALAIAACTASGCRGNPDPPRPAAQPVTAALPGDAATPADAASGDADDAGSAVDAAVIVSIGEAFARLRAGEPLPRPCFALSKNHRRVACALGGWIDYQDIGLTIGIVGETGDLVSSWTYREGPVRESNSGWVAPSNPDQLAAARIALIERGYVPNTLDEVTVGPHDTVAIGGWTVRRNRITTVEGRGWDPRIDVDFLGEPLPEGGVQPHYADGMLLQCGRRWLPLPVGPGHIFDDEGEHTLSLLPNDQLLIVQQTHYGTEGDYGGARQATVVALRALCQHP
jgi:hypothetical protein